MPIGPVIALSHGGGPMPVLNDPSHASITASLRSRVPSLLGLLSPSPSPPPAIILVTAHWRTQHPSISSAPSHPLLYDYYNFPPAAYSLSYPAPGHPALARSVSDALAAEGFSPVLDPTRGWDHGVFIPMLLIHPAASIPIVQISVLEDDDPERHLRMGRALAKFRDQGIAIVGSGFASLHNFEGYAALRTGGEDDARRWVSMVDEWNQALGGALGKPGAAGAAGAAASEQERAERLKRWRDLPHAWDMHPRGKAEHFMPLLVCAGAAAEGEQVDKYDDEYLGANFRTFYWGAEPVA